MCMNYGFGIEPNQTLPSLQCTIISPRSKPSNMISCRDHHLRCRMTGTQDLCRCDKGDRIASVTQKLRAVESPTTRAGGPPTEQTSVTRGTEPARRPTTGGHVQGQARQQMSGRGGNPPASEAEQQHVEYQVATRSGGNNAGEDDQA